MRLVTVLLVALFSSAAFAQEPQLSPNAPKDVPAAIAPGAMPAFEEALAPHVAEAMRTYPAAKAKFLAGLPDGQSFFVTTRLHDTSGNFEQVFIAVQRIEGGTISGRIWSQLNSVRSYRTGDVYTFSEADILDWLITHPDGSEEGNFVGKFLDSLYEGGT